MSRLSDTKGSISISQLLSMKSKKTSRFADPSLEDSASFFNRLFVFYMNPLFKLAVGDSLEYEDLGGISEQDASVRLANRFGTVINIYVVLFLLSF